MIFAAEFDIPAWIVLAGLAVAGSLGAVVVLLVVWLIRRRSD